MGSMTDAKRWREMQKVERARLAYLDSERKLREAVAKGRAAGLSWADLASVFGVTRSAVQQRFGGRL